MGTGSVLDEGVRNLLLRQQGWQVTTLAYTDPADLCEALLRVSPDIVVINETDPPDMAQTSDLLRSVSCDAPLRIIIARNDQNELEVYDKKRLTVTNENDFLSLLGP